MWWTYLYKDIYASIITLPWYKYLYIKNAEFKYFHIYCLLTNVVKNRVQRLFGLHSDKYKDMVSYLNFSS